MIKVAEVVRRPAGMDVASFQAHWRERHGPIVAKLPGLRRYVQSHPLPGGYAKGDLPFDGIAELWFDDKEALGAIRGSPEFAAAKADEPHFIDTTTLIELVVDEHVIKDGPAPADAIKSMILIAFDPAKDPAEAQAYWRDVHGPIATPIPQIARYVQSHVRLGAYRDGRRPPFDGIATTWFASIEDMRASGRSERFRAVVDDQALFLDPATAPAVLLTREHVVVEG